VSIYNPDQEIGQTIWASSEEDGGPDVGLLLRLSETDFIWCGEITRAEADDVGIADTGWHIVLHRGADRQVVAQVPDQFAGQELMEVIATNIKRPAASPA
jgi:hypothetical protein